MSDEQVRYYVKRMRDIMVDCAAAEVASVIWDITDEMLHTLQVESISERTEP